VFLQGAIFSEPNADSSFGPFSAVAETGAVRVDDAKAFTVHVQLDVLPSSWILTGGRLFFLHWNPAPGRRSHLGLNLHGLLLRFYIVFHFVYSLTESRRFVLKYKLNKLKYQIKEKIIFLPFSFF